MIRCDNLATAIRWFAVIAALVAVQEHAMPSSNQPTLYLFQNENATSERTVSFLATGEGTLRIGLECALGKTVNDTAGGFVEVDGRRIYTARDMRRVFSSQVAFEVTAGQHRITVGFDRPIYVAYVKIFGSRGVQELVPVRGDELDRAKTLIRQLSLSERKELLDWLKNQLEQ